MTLCFFADSKQEAALLPEKKKEEEESDKTIRNCIVIKNYIIDSLFDIYLKYKKTW